MDKRRMCPGCRAFITTDDKVCPYCQAELGPRAIDRRSPPDALGGLIPYYRFATVVILLINTGLYIVMMLRVAQSSGGRGGMDMDYRTLIEFGAKFGPAIAQGEWWRLITAGFLHGGLFHILMNSWVLFDLGPHVDQAYGTRRFLVFYFVSTVTGFLASLYWSPGSLSIGSSAGIAGLIGTMIALGIHDRSSYGAAMRGVGLRYAAYLVVMAVVPFLGVDNAAHFGGLAGGFAIAYLAGTPGYSETVENLWRLAAGVALAATGYAFFQMFLQVSASN